MFSKAQYNQTVKVHIGETETVFRTEPENKSVLKLGYKQLSGSYFSNFPPTYDEVDRAINFTEETLTPIQHLFADQLILESNDPYIKAIAELAFNTISSPEGEIRVPRIEIENVFDRFAAIVKGLPASQDVIPQDIEFAAYLLILREILHHLRFEEVRLTDV